MAVSKSLRRFFYLSATLSLSVALLTSSQAERPADDKTERAAAAGKLTETLGGEDRYLTFLSTDKPIYRPGEKVYLRGVLLHHASHQPVTADIAAQALIEIGGPKGDTVASGWVNAADSILGFQWEVPSSQAGGEYTAKVTYPWLGFPPAQRKFDVRDYRAPRLKSQIKFLRDGYGPSDHVAAMLHVERAEGGFPAGAKVTVIARVDGNETYRGSAKVDENGNCPARFQLPADIRRGEGTLAMVIEDGGVVETASKTVPILLQTVDLTFYPEGGELVAGLPNRVYFEAFTPAKKPADLAGYIVDGNDNRVATVRSEHEGRGRFQFTPTSDADYHFVISEPAGIRTRFPLPKVSKTGAVIHSLRDVYASGAPILLSVGTTTTDPITVTISQREKEIASTTLPSGDQKKQVKFDLPPIIEGILIATAWDKAGKPLAERLIFRQPSKSIDVKISADASQYVPGGKASLTIETTDEAGKPTRAWVGVTVTDDSVLEMIDKREQAPRLPVMVLLESDVQELADAHVYLDAKNPQGPLALDLLLGTQGWRRFAFVDANKFTQQHGDDARRVLALRLQTQREWMKLRAEPDMFFEMDLDDAFGVIEKRLIRLAENEVRDFEQKDKAIPVAAAAKPAADPKPAEQPARAPLEDGDRGQLRRALELADEQAPPPIIGGRFAEAKARQAQLPNDFVPIRVYAHQVRAGRQPGERSDFTETLFWHAGIQTDENGTATVEFGLNDAVTSFRVFADAFSEVGALGNSSLQIDSVEPFYIEPKLPLEVTAGDQIQLPIGVVNATDEGLEPVHVHLRTHAALKADDFNGLYLLPGGERTRMLFDTTVGSHNGPADLTVSATAGPYADRVTRTVTVRPQGFPSAIGHGGLISTGDTISHDISIPDDLVAASMQGRVVVYPTPLASMTEALKSLIREPYGCFEQTSSTTYPLVMAQQYFLSHQGVDPSLVEQSSQMLETGYNRLLGFECKSGGFEWFGNDPGHDALTAYGLLEFTDMSQVRHVDAAMLERTQKWLLAQRDGKGGFARKTHTLHTWLAEPEIANAYNAWALLEAGVQADLSTEVQWIRKAAEATENTYVMALAANVFARSGDKEGEEHMLDKLAGKQTDDGSLSGAITSVVGSGGEALKIETTALAVLAWLHNPHYAPQVEKSIQYLAEMCKGGRYGSTQSTVLSLRAIVAYDQSRAKPKSPGSLQLIVDGKPVGEPVRFDSETQGAIELPAFAELLTPGRHQVQIAMADGSQMPYSLAVEFHRRKPDSAEECKVHLQVSLADIELKEGGITEAEVAIVNRSNEAIPTPLAIIGIPGGLEVRHDQLKELVKANRIAAYEVRGREVILYWRVLKAEERVELPISLVAAIPGKYTGPASRGYLYYTDEHKHWADPLTVTITP